LDPKQVHPTGEVEKREERYPEPHRVETAGGSVEVKWNEDGGVTLNGPLVYFIEFLIKTVAAVSGNAPLEACVAERAVQGRDIGYDSGHQ